MNETDHLYLKLQRHLDPDPSALNELLAAARSAFSAALSLPVDIPDGMVIPFTLTIQDQIHLIRRTTTRGQRVVFRSLLSQAHHRLEIIVTLRRDVVKVI